MRSRMTSRTPDELDPNEGPGFGCFVWQAVLFAVILFLIPIGVFTFAWPVWLLTILMIVDLILLFFVSMTAVFLLRVFFAGRRPARGKPAGPPPKEITLDTGSEPPTTDQDPPEGSA